MRISTDDGRRGLLAGLHARRGEIDRAVLARVRAIGDPGGRADAEYLDGLRRATEAAIEHTLAAIGPAEEGPSPVPLALLTQARLAARRRIPPETMLRRYLAGHAVLGDFVVEEAGRRGVPPETLRSVLRDQAARTDRALAAISAAYVEETGESRPFTTEGRRAERVRSLLDGELVGASDLGYDLGRWHVGMIAHGAGAADSARTLAEAVDRRPLVVGQDADLVWIWLGGTHPPDAGQLGTMARWAWPEDVRVALGEPGRGLPGWRLTHQQAAAALPIARRGPERLVRYADVALPASAMQDPVLVASLRNLYLAPLSRAPDGGTVLRRTLRAYFAAGMNTTSAAAVVDADRRTVANRLRVAEGLLGCGLDSCAADLQVALWVDRFEGEKHSNQVG
jgi:hypothetical protein